jgi:hypothetical protein
MTQRRKAGDEGAGLLSWVQGLAPASPLLPALLRRLADSGYLGAPAFA